MGAGALTRRLEAETREAGTADGRERARRIRTLGRLADNVVAVFAFFLATLSILRQLNVDIVLLLTGTGVVGLAIGFGAQTLVKDVISGFFIILENQVRVGDVAIVNGAGGLVESINLRMMTLRDLAGTVHVFAVCDVMTEVAEELRDDPDFASAVLEPLEILGVDAFGGSSVTIKVRFKTLPLEQWKVGREFRRRLKKAFDARGIEIPFS